MDSNLWELYLPSMTQNKRCTNHWLAFLEEGSRLLSIQTLSNSGSPFVIMLFEVFAKLVVQEIPSSSFSQLPRTGWVTEDVLEDDLEDDLENGSL